MEQHHQLGSSGSQFLVNPEPYRRLVGRLVYLAVTRPDLSYPVHILSQFMSAPRLENWNTALRTVRYLKGTPGQGILLSSRSDMKLSGWCDSDWANCPETRRSLTGWFVFLGSSPVSWKTKKQPTNPVFHERTGHIEPDCHFVRDAIQAGLIEPSYVSTTVQLADVLTKALGVSQFVFWLASWAF
ncbi:secreted RxLR effector protein 161-like [Silene latifolia]|uniref:secreted RxLR effector protein 161-like n=1 Tax=Silene latifolia TaxID=37657 RepID=UPI003D77A2CE